MGGLEFLVYGLVHSLEHPHTLPVHAVAILTRLQDDTPPPATSRAVAVQRTAARGAPGRAGVALTEEGACPSA